MFQRNVLNTITAELVSIINMVYIVHMWFTSLKLCVFCWTTMHHTYIGKYRSMVSCYHTEAQEWISCNIGTLYIYIQNYKYSLYMAITISIVFSKNLSSKFHKYIVDGSYVYAFTLVFSLSLHPFARKSNLNWMILNDLYIMHCITVSVLLYEWLFSRECYRRGDNKFAKIKTRGKNYVLSFFYPKLKYSVEAYYMLMHV